MTTGEHAPPVIRTVAGDPDAYELAALLAVLLATGEPVATDTGRPGADPAGPPGVDAPAAQPALWRTPHGTTPAASWAANPGPAWRPAG